MAGRTRAAAQAVAGGTKGTRGTRGTRGTKGTRGTRGTGGTKGTGGSGAGPGVGQGSWPAGEAAPPEFLREPPFGRP